MSKTFLRNFLAKPAGKSLSWELRPKSYPMPGLGEWEQNFCSTPRREVSNNQVPPYPKGGAFLFPLSVWLQYSRPVPRCQQLFINFYIIFYNLFGLQGWRRLTHLSVNRCVNRVNRGGWEPQAHTLGAVFPERLTHFAPVYTWLTHLCVNPTLNVYARKQPILPHLCRFYALLTV